MSDVAATIAVDSNNRKIGSKRTAAKVATTWVSIKASCSRACRQFKTGTCYAMDFPAAFTVRRLDESVSRLSPLRAARDEAAAIDGAFGGGRVPQDGMKGGRDLRLHSSGDCSTPEAAALVGAAAARWVARGGGRVWTYTHSWSDIPRAAWGAAVSVLASIDDVRDAYKAIGMGYAVTRVVDEFPAKSWREAGILWIGCLAQLRDNTGCADCGLCMQADTLRARGIGVAFKAHGQKQATLRRHLAVMKG